MKTKCRAYRDFPAHPASIIKHLNLLCSWPNDLPVFIFIFCIVIPDSAEAALVQKRNILSMIQFNVLFTLFNVQNERKDILRRRQNHILKNLNITPNKCFSAVWESAESSKMLSRTAPSQTERCPEQCLFKAERWQG